MIDAALPGGRVVAMRRLRGGLSAYVHAVTVQMPDGGIARVVLRRGSGSSHLATPQKALAEFRTLAILAEAGVPAPSPLLLDALGRYFDAPAILTSYNGRPLVTPRHASRWLGGMADALLTLRRVTPARFDLSFLSAYGSDQVHERAALPPADTLATDRLALAASDALRQNVDRLSPPSPCLVHCDFWPGNTVWRRGQLSAIIDWSTAVVGDPRIDVAQCRVDLAMMHGMAWADAFLDAYRSHSAAPVTDIWFFDLLIGLHAALATFTEWLPGYQDIGLTHLTACLIEQRLRTFLTTALESARAGTA